MSAGRVTLLVFGSLATLVALGALAAGAFGLWLHETKRDEDGFYTTRTELSTPTYALSSEGFDIADVDDWPFGEGTFATVRLQGASVDPAHEIFIGIAPERDARRYLAGVEHDEVVDLNFGGSFDDATVDYRRRPGSTTPSTPADQSFWAASVSGSGSQTLDWDLEDGRWTIVVMNADAAPDVEVDMTLGAKVPFILGLAIGLLAGGALLLLAGATMLYFGARSRPAAAGPRRGGCSGRGRRGGVRRAPRRSLPRRKLRLPRSRGSPTRSPSRESSTRASRAGSGSPSGCSRFRTIWCSGFSGSRSS